MNVRAVEVATPIVVLLGAAFGPMGIVISLAMLAFGGMALVRDAALDRRGRAVLGALWTLVFLSAYAASFAFFALSHAKTTGQTPPEWTNIIFPAFLVCLGCLVVAEVRAVRVER